MPIHYRRPVLLMLYFACLLLLVENSVFCPILLAEIPYESKDFSFGITIPSDFEILKPSEDYVGLALRHKTGDFPTFNIIVQPEPSFTPTNTLTNLAEYGKRTLASYRRVGLTDASLVGAPEQIIGLNKGFFATIQYKQEGRLIQSIVSTIWVNSREYIMTFLDYAENMHVHKGLNDSLVGSFRVLQAGSTSAAEEESQGAQGTPWLSTQGILFILFCSILVIVFVRYRSCNR